MRRWRQIAAKVFALGRRSRSEQALAKEIGAHLAMLEEDFRQRGFAPEEARAAARRAFGSVEQTKEQYRDQRSFLCLEQFWQDLRHAARSLRNSPGFSIVAVLSLAFGIGVNTAIFTLVNGILLKRLPMPEADRVVQIETRGKGWTSTGISYPQFDALRRQEAIFSDAVAFSPTRMVLDSGENPQQMDGELVTGNYFSFFKGEPVLGRLLTEEDDRVEGAHAVCVLSYQAWCSRFGSDPRVLGRIIRLNTYPFEIAGVAGPDFVGAELQNRYDIWVPTAMSHALSLNARSSPNVIWLRALAKLRPELSAVEARARLQAASKAMNEALPKDRVNADAVVDFTDGSKGFDNFRTRLQEPLLSAVVLVLLIACANLTNLLLARANERAQEFSVKLSLGIARLRLLRQLLLESLLLTFAGGVAAILAARALVVILLRLFNTGENWRALEIEMDPAVFAFTFGVCAVIALAVGVYPAWAAIETDITPALKGATRSGVQKNFIRRAMIVVQISLSVVLLFGTSVFSHSLRKLKTVDLGFDIEHVALIEINYRGKDAFAAGTDVAPMLNDVLERTRTLPGVEPADLANPSMLSGASMISTVHARGTDEKTRKIDDAYFVFASPQHFKTLRIPLLRGRDFTSRDRKGAAPVAIVNQRLAALLWPGEDPVGKQLVGGWAKDPIVIGVTGNTKYTDVRENLQPIVYEPLAQTSVVGASLEVRSRLPLSQIERQVRSMVRSSAPGFQVANVSSMELLRDHVLAQDRLLTFLAVLFGLLGTTLALVGIYGLISYAVTRRTREIGIRMSVGAQRSQVLSLFLRETILMAACGAAIGLPLALLVSKPLKNFLYEVPAADPLGIAITLLLIVLGSLAAAFVPARRAMQVDPVEALRYE